MNKDIGRITPYNVVLHFKSWIKDVPEDKIVVFVAIALNYCVSKKEMSIKGYFITKSNLYLVIRLDKYSLKEMLTVLSEQIALCVYTHLNDSQKGEEEFSSPENQYAMFTKHVLRDHNLIDIITGKDVALPYHSPRLAYLKTITHHCKYCSVSDYRGVLGPVIVNTQRQEI